jgi:hypothetical protein
VDEHNSGVVLGKGLGPQRRAHAGAGTGIVLYGGRQRLVGHQLGLHHQPCWGVERLDLVQDGGDRSLHERDEPYRGHPYRLPGRRDPLGPPSQRPVAKVEDTLVSTQPSVADVKRLVVHEQADYLSVGDVDQRLPGLGIAVARLGVGQWPRLVKAVEVCARQAVRLALL